MAARSLRQAVLDGLQPRLASEGFKLKRSDDQFVRNLEGVTHYFAFIFQNERPGCHVEPLVKLRINRVQEIFHQFMDWGPHSPPSHTLALTLGHCVCDEGRSCEFFVGSVDDVPAQVEHLMRVFHGSALPYYQHWQSLQAIDAELNDRSPDSPSLHLRAESMRFPVAIIVAKLVGRSDFDQLAANYMRKTCLHPAGFYRPSFEALVSYLKDVEPWSGLPQALLPNKASSSESGE